MKRDRSRLREKNLFDGNLQFGAKLFHEKTNRTGQGRPASGGLVPEHAKIVMDTGNERYQRYGEFWEVVEQCPVCRSIEHRFLFNRLGLEIWRCAVCDHGFQNPRITFNKAVEIYSDDKTAADIYTEPLQKDIDRVKYSYGLKLIEEFNGPTKGKLLDFGCGAGVFLEVASSLGWKECIGIDANSRYQDQYKSEPGIQFINSSFDKIDKSTLGGSYDCISLWNVLEHLYHPNEMVQEFKSMLKPEGLIFIMVPNAKSFATRIIREKSATFNWKHVSHFCSQSLERLMTQNGFKQVHLETAISEIDNVKSYLSGADPYGGYGDPDGLFDFVTPKYLHDNLLGSRLIGIFRNA